MSTPRTWTTAEDIGIRVPHVKFWIGANSRFDLCDGSIPFGDGYVLSCGRPLGHTGRHNAHGADGQVYAVWGDER